MHKLEWGQLLKRFSPVLSLASTLAIIVPYYVGGWIGEQGNFGSPQISGLWCGISGLLVLQVSLHESFSAAWLRIAGSFLGALTSFIFVSFMGYTIPALAICIFITVMLTSLFNIIEVFRVASLTVAVIILVGSLEQTGSPFMNSFARFIESAVGSLIGIVITLIFYPLRKKLIDQGLAHQNKIHH